MAIVIEFPGKDVQLKRKLLEKLNPINFPSDDLKNCVKEKVLPVFEKYGRLPTHTLSLELPYEISEEQTQQISNQIAGEMSDYAKKIAQDLVLQICLLHVELCKSLLKNN